MDKFERLNRETSEYNNRRRNMDPTGSNYGSTPKYGTSEYWRNYWNNQTYKTNNGQYSKKYF